MLPPSSAETADVCGVRDFLGGGAEGELTAAGEGCGDELGDGEPIKRRSDMEISKCKQGQNITTNINATTNPQMSLLSFVHSIVVVIAKCSNGALLVGELFVDCCSCCYTEITWSCTLIITAHSRVIIQCYSSNAISHR